MSFVTGRTPGISYMTCPAPAAATTRGTLVKRRSWIGAIALVTVLATLTAACGSGRSDDNSSSNSGTSGTAATATAAAGSFGTLSDVCGPGDAKGATDKGVTDTDITIGYGDDAGYTASPGLNH